MAPIRASLALLVLTVLAVPAQADVYRYIDKNGNLVLTDQAVPGAVKVQEKPVMTIPALKGLTPTGNKKKTDTKAAPLKDYAITIASPAPESTFQRYSGDAVPVAVSVSPDLDGGLTLKLLLDGQPYDGGQLPLDEMDRGKHVLSAVIVDEAGNVVLQGPANSFYVQQHGQAGKP